MSYKIYLDDIRMPSETYPDTRDEHWMIVRNLTDFKHTIETYGVPECISFDNDLGDTMEESKDGVKWMVYEKELDITNMKFAAHSANSGGPGGPDGDIVGLLNNWKKELIKRKEQSGK